jgi:thiol-disulfide isomerase/thioredoxin
MNLRNTLALFALSITIWQADGAATASTLLKVGAVAPDFVSNDPAGKKVNLSDFKGKVVVLDFWATWCGPCIASLPHTQEVAKQGKDQGVVVLAACTSDTRAAFDKWLKANQGKFPDIVFTSDPNERGSAGYAERASSKHYGVSGIPTQFVIGRDGKVVASIVGYSAGDSRLEAALARAGVKVDPDAAAKGEEKFKKSAGQ